MTVTIIILCLSAILFVNGRIRSDLVAVCTALALVLCGILSPEEALSGFANPIVIMMAGLFVVGEGIFSTGLAGQVGRRIMGLAGGNETRLFVLVMLATSFVGAFVSNTGTVALMLPIVVSLCRTAGFSQSRLLMPLAFAGSMGGMLTLIGTPPNLIVRDALVQAGYEPLGFFSFAPVGVLCIITGIVVLLPLTRRFLRHKAQSTVAPIGKSPEQLAEEYNLTQGLTRLTIEPGSPFAGKTLRELDVHSRYGITVFEIRRTAQTGGGTVLRVEQYTLAETVLNVGDQLFLSGAPQSVELMAAENGLKMVKLKKGGKLHFYDIGMAEILILPTSSLVGLSVAKAAFREQHGLNVYGVKRHEQRITSNLKDFKLHAADILLVQGPWSNIARLAKDEGREWVVIGQPEKQAARITLDYKAPLAAFIMVAMVAVMALPFIPVAPVTAVMLAAVAMVFTGCVRGVEVAYKSINWESIVLFGAMLPMSTALEKTGASSAISLGLVSAVGEAGPYVLLAAIYLATSVMTFFISNTVTAVLMAPIAIAVAAAQGVSAVPLLMAVTVAASMCFASPFSTPPNALVMSAGGYRAVDYVRVGLPLQIITAIVMIVALPLLFPF
ncbi:MAG: SLC13 family permease [Muribaculaceae bacterium]